jgi:hypothetical protein
MKFLNLIIWLSFCLLLACGGGVDTGNPIDPAAPEDLCPPAEEDPADGCQEPFAVTCKNGRSFIKDPETCVWEADE